MFRYFLFLTCFLGYINAQSQSSRPSKELVYLDKNGVIRWTDSKKEVSLFGANYCLPSASDYRAAGRKTNNRKEVIDQDMAHFARMDFDALRLCFWGDFENTDKDGNLKQNDHLDLLDYLIFKARQRGVYMLLSPIVTYSSLFPDSYGDPSKVKGSLSDTFKKDELGTNPNAIAAQANYLRQLLDHVNPYTGLALKNDPSILFVEMINEPTHHSADLQGSIKYINALVEAVRSTGCQKIVFHNLTQDFAIAPALAKSTIQGLSFAWYPTGLNSGRTLNANYLPVVDLFSKDIMGKDLSKLARIVYEFDNPDQVNGFMYPAMARSFRGGGAQWASMFSYDMLITAPYNLSWETHYFNMVYTPTRAVSGMIAAEIMRKEAMYKDYGKYPQNTRFGDFRLDYDTNLSEMNSPEKFYYSSSTTSEPVDINRLKRIAGVGSSKVINYEGKGIYFLDKVSSGVWRLEVYPDALPISDPFKSVNPDKIVTRSISRTWPMAVRLPGLGESFNVTALNSENNFSSKAEGSKFSIRPGVYILSSKAFNASALPARLGFVNMREFVSLADQELPMQVFSGHQIQFVSGKDFSITADIYHAKEPESVTLYYRSGNRRRFSSLPMKRKDGYTYSADVAWDARNLEGNTISWYIMVKDAEQSKIYPSGASVTPAAANFSVAETWSAKLIPDGAAVKLVEVGKDLESAAFTRIGDNIRSGVYKLTVSSLTGDDAVRLELPLNHDKELDDYSMSVPVKKKLENLTSMLSAAKGVSVFTRGESKSQDAYLTLVEKDGTSWSCKIPASSEWRLLNIPLSDFKLSKGAMLPLGYPGRWNYWFTPAAGRVAGSIKIADVEHVQISMRPSSNVHVNPAAPDSFVEVTGINLTF